jgi:hypothetical protein
VARRNDRRVSIARPFVELAGDHAAGVAKYMPAEVNY